MGPVFTLGECLFYMFASFVLGASCVLLAFMR